MDWLKKPDGTLHRYGRVPLIANADTRLKDRERRVLNVLFAYADSSGKCHPSRKAIAAYSGIGKIQFVSQATTSLEKHGWLKKIVNRGAGHSNNYQLIIPAEAIAIAGEILEKLKSEEAETKVPDLGTISDEKKVPNLGTIEDTKVPDLGIYKGPQFGSIKVPNLGTLTDQEQTNEQTSAKTVSAVADVAAVFEHWKNVMESPKSVLDGKRKDFIKGRLKEGFTVEDLKQAIDGCRNSEWHMGKNDNGVKYNGINLICRDASKVESFMGLGAPKVSSNDNLIEKYREETLRRKKEEEENKAFWKSPEGIEVARKRKEDIDALFKRGIGK